MTMTRSAPADAILLCAKWVVGVLLGDVCRSGVFVGVRVGVWRGGLGPGCPGAAREDL
jgi:hypothetical protein